MHLCILELVRPVARHASQQVGLTRERRQRHGALGIRGGLRGGFQTQAALRLLCKNHRQIRALRDLQARLPQRVEEREAVGGVGNEQPGQDAVEFRGRRARGLEDSRAAGEGHLGSFQGGCREAFPGLGRGDPPSRGRGPFRAPREGIASREPFRRRQVGSQRLQLFIEPSDRDERGRAMTARRQVLVRVTPFDVVQVGRRVAQQREIVQVARRPQFRHLRSLLRQRLIVFHTPE